MSFIYVFNSEDRDELLKRGYALLKSDDAQSIYVFKNNTDHTFSSAEFSYVISDKLTF